MFGDLPSLREWWQHFRMLLSGRVDPSHPWCPLCSSRNLRS